MPKVLVASLREQRAATLEQLEQLADDDWGLQCLPPWRVRDVVAHLVSVDEAIVTARMLAVLRRADRAAVERWNDAAVLKLVELDREELLERLVRRGATVGALARRLPPVLDRVRVRTVYGRLSLRSLLCLRVVDEWVHTTDIAAATGVPARLAPSVPASLATGVLARLPADVLPRVVRPVGVLRLEVGTGERGSDGQARSWGVDFARRQFGPRVQAAPDVTVHVHASTLALLAAARLGWREALPGSIMIEGDREVASGLLDVLGH
jgi:uncharacterized protein (TIGR03083 family)